MAKIITLFEKQQRRILDEFAEMRLMLSSGLAEIRDGQNVLTAMAFKSERANQKQQEINEHMLNRIRKLEAGQE